MFKDKNGKRLSPILQRIFNDGSLYKTGRFYTDIQFLPKNKAQNDGKKDRELITINGNKVIEHDFTSMHPTLLYTINGLKSPADCYDIKTSAFKGRWNAVDRRNLIKHALVIIINAKSTREAIQCIQHKLMTSYIDNNIILAQKQTAKDYIKTHYHQLKTAINVDVTHLVRDIKHAHSPIASYFCSSAGVRLMRIESEIASKILEYFLSRGIACLPVHDSFIVEEQYGEELKSVMERFFNEVVTSPFVNRVISVIPKKAIKQPKSSQPGTLAAIKACFRNAKTIFNLKLVERPLLNNLISRCFRLRFKGS